MLKINRKIYTITIVIMALLLGYGTAGNIALSGESQINLPPNYEYDTLTVDGQSNVILTSGDYIFESILVSGNGMITVNPVDRDGDGANDPVNIWVRNLLDIGGNGMVNTGKPTDLFIYGTGTNPEVIWNFHGNANLSAGVYAPELQVQVGGAGSSGEVYGSLAAKTVLLNGTNTQIHFDESLGEMPPREIFLGLDKENMTWMIK